MTVVITKNMDGQYNLFYGLEVSVRVFPGQPMATTSSLTYQFCRSNCFVGHYYCPVIPRWSLIINIYVNTQSHINLSSNVITLTLNESDVYIYNM